MDDLSEPLADTAIGVGVDANQPSFVLVAFLRHKLQFVWDHLCNCSTCFLKFLVKARGGAEESGKRNRTENGHDIAKNIL